MQTSKKNKNIIGIIQSFLILILVVLIIFMMIQISRLQGTARVINYAGLVRGATQREVKLEITGNQNDELIKYLDDILLGLRYQDGHYDLVKLNDEEYQEKLQIQSDYWDKLKTEIEAVRNKGYEKTDIPIDYACGWALSSDNMSCTMQMLLDDADANMYKNKQLCKRYNQHS